MPNRSANSLRENSKILEERHYCLPKKVNHFGQLHGMNGSWHTCVTYFNVTVTCNMNNTMQNPDRQDFSLASKWMPRVMFGTPQLRQNFVTGYRNRRHIWCATRTFDCETAGGPFCRGRAARSEKEARSSIPPPEPRCPLSAGLRSRLRETQIHPLKMVGWPGTGTQPLSPPSLSVRNSA